jgi:menaquinol-cytochrome c reductase iron-sulfur subunit
MSENKPQENQASEVRQKAKKEMSRRQFLTYTLGGTGGFLAAAMLVPMVRFAVDPVLQPKVKADWVKVVEESKISDVPKSFKFQIHQVDGWYESDPELEAWISKEADGTVLALNPTCKHLGCTVSWAGNPEHKDQYACPCHGAQYTKEGKALKVAKLPLDQYSVKTENGFIYVGQLHANEIAK